MLLPAPDCESSTSLSVPAQCHGHPSSERLVLDGVSGAATTLNSKNSAWKELDVNIRERQEDAGKDMVQTAWAVAGRASEPDLSPGCVKASREGPRKGSASKDFLSPPSTLQCR